MAYYITSACTKCDACLFECPTNSIIEGKDKYFIDTDTCDDYKACVAVCPVNAIIPFNPSYVDIPSGKPNAPTTPSKK